MEILENILLPSSIVSAMLIVWFKTEAFVEYGSLLGLSKYLYLSEYKIAQKNDPSLEFPMFLVINNNNFFSRLLSCPLCLGFWLSLLFSCVFDVRLVFSVYVISLILFFYLNNIMHERD